jgi:hypothetical protein
MQEACSKPVLSYYVLERVIDDRVPAVLYACIAKLAFLRLIRNKCSHKRNQLNDRISI